MKKLATISLISSLLFTTGGCSLANTSNTTTEPTTNQSSLVASNQEFSYEDYANVLASYVDDQGLVDYQSLQSNRAQLDKFNNSLGAVSAATYASWNESEKLAFLINAYNSFTLQSIIDRQPLPKSIRDIPGVWKSRKFNIAGTQKTLNNIEHDTLRVEFNEPRIHAALVCAAISCPPLRNEPYTAEKVDEQLKDQSLKWLASSHGVEIDSANKKVKISAIFKWFGKDWVANYGETSKFKGSQKDKAILNFISQHISAQDKQLLEQGNFKINFLKYDWSLNRKS